MDVGYAADRFQVDAEMIIDHLCAQFDICVLLTVGHRAVICIGRTKTCRCAREAQRRIHRFRHSGKHRFDERINALLRSLLGMRVRVIQPFRCIVDEVDHRRDALIIILGYRRKRLQLFKYIFAHFGDIAQRVDPVADLCGDIACALISIQRIARVDDQLELLAQRGCLCRVILLYGQLALKRLKVRDQIDRLIGLRERHRGRSTVLTEDLKRLKRLLIVGDDARPGILPAELAVICLAVPSVIRDAEERDLAGLCLDHRVRDESAHVLDARLQRLCRSHMQQV